MNDYIKKDKQERLKRYLRTVIFILLVFIICVLAYYIYMQIDVDKPKLSTYETSKQNNLPVETVENIEKKDKGIADIISDVNECVVGISKIKEVGESIFLQDGASKLGLGTGLIVSEDGYILTNEHVSGKKNSTCYITLSTGKNYTGTVVWSNSDIDMSIIKINEKKLNYASLGDSDAISVGESVYAIGNPIGYEFQRTVTSGIISALDRTIRLEENGEETYMEDLIQTDATINPGNSGGPLVNSRGEVVGINSIKITSAEGIGFAVPINSVKAVVESYANTGRFNEARLGVYAFDTNVISYMKAQSKTGIYVTKVVNGTAADKAQIQKGDVVLSIDNEPLERMCELRRYIYTKNPKDEVTLKILRNNREMEVIAVLEKK